jgi:predicted PhzF superfamily epimerase YddE/YHI9
MRAYQASERGGELLLELRGQRVYITGEAVTVVRGHLEY